MKDLIVLALKHVGHYGLHIALVVAGLALFVGLVQVGLPGRRRNGIGR